MLAVLYIYLEQQNGHLVVDEAFLDQFCEKLRQKGFDRTKSSIGMRIGNYIAADPNNGATGLVNSKMAKTVFDKYSKQPDVPKRAFLEIMRDTRQLTQAEIDDLRKIRNDYEEKFSHDTRPHTQKTTLRTDEDLFIESNIKRRNMKIQQFFREGLIREFSGKCVLCGAGVEWPQDMLVASHIWPYSRCKKIEEAANSSDGLLLCPEHDMLFDKLYISFDEDGSLLISPKLRQSVLSHCSLTPSVILPEKCLTEERRKFLSLHRNLFNCNS